MVSDLCGALTSFTKSIGAIHSPDLFHGCYEISKATSASLSSQERAAEKKLNKAEEKFKKKSEKLRMSTKMEIQQQKEEIDVLRKRCEDLRIDYKKRKDRREKSREANKKIGAIYHPIDIESGLLQPPETVEARFKQQLDVIEENAKEAKLSESSFNRIEKAKRAFSLMAIYLSNFFTVFYAFINDMNLDPQQTIFFNEVIFPLCYFQIIWKRFSKQDKVKYATLLQMLQTKLQEAPWLESLKTMWMLNGKELAERFQRSSSFLEGRNGGLSLLHHRFHRLSERDLKVLGIIQNFHVRHSDGTTAAERLFKTKHGDLFKSLVENVRIPGRPKRQHHDIKTRQLGREKQRAA